MNFLFYASYFSVWLQLFKKFVGVSIFFSIVTGSNLRKCFPLKHRMNSSWVSDGPRGVELFWVESRFCCDAFHQGFCQIFKIPVRFRRNLKVYFKETLELHSVFEWPLENIFKIPKVFNPYINPRQLSSVL